jgi:hypothetical protein
MLTVVFCDMQGWRGDDLPVPLLKAHADKLLADGDKARALVSAPAKGGGSSS